MDSTDTYCHLHSDFYLHADPDNYSNFNCDSYFDAPTNQDYIPDFYDHSDDYSHTYGFANNTFGYAYSYTDLDAKPSA